MASSKLLSLPLLCLSALSLSMTRILSRVWSPLKLDHQEVHYYYSLRMGSFQSSVAVGLGILTEISRRDSHVVFNSALKKFIKQPTFQTMTRTHSSSIDYRLLKTCFLCNKTLSLDKDVYMYRGDQGFCSEECRSRQIYLDEIKEIQISTREILAASTRRCRDSILLEENRLRHRQQPMTRQKNRPIFLLGGI